MVDPRQQPRYRKAELWAELDSLGEQKVRERLLSGHYGDAGEDRSLAVLWLHVNGVSRKDASQSRQADAASRASMLADRAADAAARQAIAAERAYAKADTAMAIAVAALIVAIASFIISLVEMVYPGFIF